MLHDIENNLKTLISAYETQRDRAERLAAELESSRREAGEAKAKVKELEEKVDRFALTSAFTSSAGENTEAKARIDELIATIDRALELLR